MQLDRFLRYLQFEKRYSPHTIAAYQRDLLQFQDYCNTSYDATSLEAASTVIIRSWIVKMINDGLDPRSVNRKISALKTFFKFMLTSGVIEASPMKKIIAPKTSKKLPQVIEEHQMRKLFSQVLAEEGFEGLRDLLILELLYATGIRRSELIGLNVGDVDHSNLTIRVLGKGRKERLIPITRELSHRVKQYLEQRDVEFGIQGESALFVTKRGERIYPRKVHTIVTKNLSLVSTADKKSPHVLRHTFATHLLSNGAELSAIKELMGHAGLAATQVYTHTSVEKLKATYKRAHPKAG